MPNDVNTEEVTEVPLEEGVTAIVKIVHVKGTNSGGGPFKDQSDIVNNGPISEIRLWTGDHGIMGIAMAYDGYEGKKWGDTSGEPRTFTVPENHYIDEIRLAHGEFLDSIQFVTKSLGGGNRREMSPVYGKEGDNHTTVRSEEGYPLRSISGHSGSRLDALDFNFGYLSRIKSAVIDAEKLRQQIGDPNRRKLVALRTAKFRNETTVANEGHFLDSRSRTESYSLTWELGVRAMFGYTYSTTGSAGVPVASAETTSEFSFEFEVSFSIGATTTKETSETSEFNYTVNVPPWSQVEVIGTAHEAELEGIPITMVVEFIKLVGGLPVAEKRTTVKAFLSGKIRANNVDYQVKQYNIANTSPPSIPTVD